MNRRFWSLMVVPLIAGFPAVAAGQASEGRSFELSTLHRAAIDERLYSEPGLRAVMVLSASVVMHIETTLAGLVIALGADGAIGPGVRDAPHGDQHGRRVRSRP